MDPTTPTTTTPPAGHVDPGVPGPAVALQSALAGLLASVAELAVARGLPFEAVQEALKAAFVQSASRAHPGLAEHRKVSRISTTTGINRREVTRLAQLAAAQQQAGPTPARVGPARSLASEVFTHWRASPDCLDLQGRPLVLRRLGPAPSFEALAQGVTRDVHPRGLLDELCRLALARWDTVADTVQLADEPFVPKGDQARLLGFLGDNVGDHLRGAVANVLGQGNEHFEQAVFADGLSAQAIAAMRPVIAAQWRSLLQALVPALEAHVQAGAQLQPPAAGRLRVGLYSFDEGAGAAPAGAGADAGAGAAGPVAAKPLPRRVARPKTQTPLPTLAKGLPPDADPV